MHGPTRPDPLFDEFTPPDLFTIREGADERCVEDGPDEQWEDTECDDDSEPARDYASSPGEPDYEHELFDLETWLPELFSHWVDGSEERWAKSAWDALGKQGSLKDWDLPEEVVHNAGLLMTLSAIFQEFTRQREGAGEGDSWPWTHHYVNADDISTTDIAAGRFAEATGLEGDTFSEILHSAPYTFKSRVVSALEAEWGRNEFFTSLWLTAKPEVIYPITPEVAGTIMNAPTDDMSVCYQWYTEGCQL